MRGLGSDARRGLLGVVVLAMFAAGMRPVIADPDLVPDAFPPVVSLALAEEDPLTLELGARAVDSDGRIREVEMCVSLVGSGAPDCSSSPVPPADPVADALACSSGDEVTFDRTFTAAAAAWHHAEVRAVGGRCPGLLSSESRAEHLVAIAPKLAPVDCADDGPLFPSDIGVDATTIRLGVTASLSGREPGVDHRAIRAAEAAINNAGGVCGRTLRIEIADDGSNHPVGRDAITAMIDDGVFALVSMPGWRGLEAVATDGSLTAAGVPVVGTAGRTDAEFSHDLIWPLAPPAEAFAAIGVAHAYDAGARTFAIVTSDDTAATQTAAAIQAELAGRAGTEVRYTLAFRDTANFSHQVVEMKDACGGSCDAVVLDAGALDAMQWQAAVEQHNAQPSIETSASPRAASARAGVACGPACDGMLVWSGVELPVSDAGPEALRYAADAGGHALDHVLANGASVEAAYAGVVLAARAMGAAGTDLTRAGLAAVLDAQSFDLGLTAGPLAWDPGARDANRWMRPYRLDRASPFGLEPAGGWVLGT